MRNELIVNVVFNPTIKWSRRCHPKVDFMATQSYGPFLIAVSHAIGLKTILPNQTLTFSSRTFQMFPSGQGDGKYVHRKPSRLYKSELGIRWYILVRGTPPHNHPDSWEVQCG